jgi:F420-dependent oxidoreductase-like protein
MELKLPAPSLIVLVGPSASGKSTWAARHFAESEIVSSDRLRAMVGAGEDDQVAGTAAFDLLNRIVSARLERGLTTVIDTLGYERDSRRRWVAEAHGFGVPAHAVVFDTTAEVAEERNSARARPIPKTALRRQLTRMKTVVGELDEDEFDGIHRERPVAVVTPAVAAVGARDESQLEPRHTFGLMLSRFNWGDGDLGERLRAVGRRAEAAGFRDLWVMDHFRQIPVVGRAWEDIPEAYTALSYVAASTSTIRLGAMVTAVTHRHPVVLGKMLASLDVLSGGRAVCGLGVGWDEEEHAGYGIEFPPVRERYRLLEETLQMLPLLWGKGTPAYHGELIDAPSLVCYPRPVQDSIPILIGGSGERKTLRLVAEYADACNLFGDPDRIRHKVEVLEAHCAAVERDPSEIEVTHLTSALAAPDRQSLRDRIEAMRERNTPSDSYMRRVNAGTIDDLETLFSRYREAGAANSIVSLPDVAAPGSIEAFGDLIARFDSS